MKTKRSKSYFLTDLNVKQFKEVICNERKSAMIPETIQPRHSKSTLSTYCKMPTKKNMSRSILENQQIEKLKQKFEKNCMNKAYYFSSIPIHEVQEEQKNFIKIFGNKHYLGSIESCEELESNLTASDLSIERGKSYRTKQIHPPLLKGLNSSFGKNMLTPASKNTRNYEFISHINTERELKLPSIVHFQTTENKSDKSMTELTEINSVLEDSFTGK